MGFPRSIIAALALAAAVPPAFPGANNVDTGLFFSQGAGLACNQAGPTGLLLDTRFYWRFHAPDTKIPLGYDELTLYNECKLDIGFENILSPADEQISFFIWAEPLAFFDIKARAGFYLIHDALGLGLAPASSYYQDPYFYTNAGSARETRAGFWLQVAPNLKLKFGPVIFTSSLAVNYINIAGFTGYYLERQSFLVHRGSDYDIVSDSSLLVDPNGDGSFYFGLNYNHAVTPGNGIFYPRPAGVLVFKPSYENLYDFYAAVMAGWNFRLNEFFLGYALGITLKLA